MVRVVNRSEAEMETKRQVVREQNRSMFNSRASGGRVYDRRALGLYVDLLVLEGVSKDEAWNVIASRYDAAHAGWCVSVCG